MAVREWSPPKVRKGMRRGAGRPPHPPCHPSAVVSHRAESSPRHVCAVPHAQHAKKIKKKSDHQIVRFVPRQKQIVCVFLLRSNKQKHHSQLFPTCTLTFRPFKHSTCKQLNRTRATGSFSQSAKYLRVRPKVLDWEVNGVFLGGVGR